MVQEFLSQAEAVFFLHEALRRLVEEPHPLVGEERQDEEARQKNGRNQTSDSGLIHREGLLWWHCCAYYAALAGKIQKLE
jgi:hypothetical protein